MGYRTYTCPVNRRCGGCELLTRPYPIQLERKQGEVEELFSDHGAHLVEPIIGMEEPLRYRTKVLTPFAPGKDGRIVYGLYQKHSHRIVPHDDCLVACEQAQPILDTIARLMPSFKMRPYDEDRGEGLVRHVLIRASRATGDVMVTLVCTRPYFPSQKTFVRVLRKEHPEIATVVLNVNARDTNVVLGESERVLFGPGWITEDLLGCRFRLSSQSFFQTNPAQTERLYARALEYAQLTGVETALDAYCGIGTIGILTSMHAGFVRGVERNERAVRDARANARINRRDNVEFTCADATTFMREAARAGDSCDVVFLDPPRAGATPAFLDAVAQLGARRVVYISCNPATQRRDVDHLVQEDYVLERVQPVDMFPHTHHIETVALLSRAKK
jgi:23S rRNA (uracil1939-C5)-methyltransferase